MRKTILTLAAMLATTGAHAAPPTVESEVARARQLAGSDFSGSMFVCEANTTKVADMLAGGPTRFPPMKAFDNL